MDDETPPPRIPRHQRRRYRVEELDIDHFAVVERLTSDVVEAGFESYTAAWTWIANRLDGR
jgi:hypothetical protein